MRTLLYLFVIGGICTLAQTQDSDNKVNHFISLGAHASVDPLTQIDDNKMVSFYGLNSNIKLGKLFLGGEYMYHPGIISVNQVVSELSSYGGRIGFTFASPMSDGNAFGALTLGYNSNTWIRSISQEPNDNNVRVQDYTGKDYYLKYILINYEAPYYTFGYSFMSLKNSDYSRREVVVDEYDAQRFKKRRAAALLMGGIELHYAPVIKYHKEITYSPWGYYVPKTLEIDTDMKLKHFGASVFMLANLSAGLGFKAQMGLIPGIVNANADAKVNLVIRIGLLYNLTFARK